MSGTDSSLRLIETLRLIELTSATLCHDISDLVGSLGQAGAASGNRSADAPDFEKAALNTAQALTTRLALRRAAWGPDGEKLPLARILSLADGLPQHVAVDASALDPDAVFPATAGRIVLNLLLLATDSLPSGGTVMIAGAPDDLFVRIAGPAAAWPPGMADCLANETAARFALNAWHAPQMALTALLAHNAGIRLSVLLSATAQNEPAILRLGG